MADLFTVTAPLSVRLPDGTSKVVAECFRHGQGLLYFDLYWHLDQPERVMHVLEGEVSGDGPWKVADHVFNVLGCQGTDPQLAGQFAAWESFLQRADSDYPPPQLVAAIARRMGAVTTG